MLEFLIERSKFMMIGVFTIIDGLVLLLSLGCYRSRFAHIFASWLTRRKLQRQLQSSLNQKRWPQATPSEEDLKRAERVKKAL